MINEETGEVRQNLTAFDADELPFQPRYSLWDPEEWDTRISAQSVKLIFFSIKKTKRHACRSPAGNVTENSSDESATSAWVIWDRCEGPTG